VSRATPELTGPVYSETAPRRVSDPARNEVRLEDLLGREVYAGNNRRVGRIEEIRAQWTGASCAVTSFVIGTAGLLERLGLGARMVVGWRAVNGRVARWDQVDLSNPERPRLTCPIDDLEEA
jgi:sporulation protein YlmC with PRC-barrel domain